MQTRILAMKLSNAEKGLITVAYVAICVVVYLTVIVPIGDWYGWPIPEQNILEVVTAALYPIFDLVLLICVMVVFAKFRHGKINTAWILLLIGLICNIIADIIFNYVENVTGEYLLFEWYDLLFLISYTLIAISALEVINVMSKAFDTEK